MNELLLFLGESTSGTLRDRIPDFIKNSQLISKGCHVADNLWAVRSLGSQEQVFDALAMFLGDPSIRIVVARLGDGWTEANCTSVSKCFRSD
jgi:hypothetical protein